MLRQNAPAVAVVLCVFAPALALCSEEPSLVFSSPAPRILVLRNGQTLEGRIGQIEGYYVVDLPNGQIRVKSADVELVCSSLEDGYRKKRAAIQIGNVHDHLQLAQWCLRHGLLSQAGEELADATAAEPNHRMIGALRHRLEMAQSPLPTAEATHISAPGPSNEELDRMVRSLPRGTVEAFTQSVQPVLMNHCATGGCHGPQSQTALRLFRTGSGKSASQRVTQRNLFAVLPFLDRENPANSKLLIAAQRAHGTVQQAVFTKPQMAQYQRLVDWANRLGE